MKSRILIGRYVPGNSRIHQLDPRLKIVAFPLYMAAVFLIRDFLAAIVLAFFTVLAVLISKIPVRLFARAVQPLLFILLFIFFFHLLFETSGTTWLDAGLFRIYTGGLYKGLLAAVRMVLFLLFAVLITFTTPPDRLAEGLSSVLKPLRAVGVPVDSLTLMLRISLRFLPSVWDEAERLWKAQLSRGLDLGTKPSKERARLLMALLVPVTDGAFRRAMQLAEAMEARGFRLGNPRTSYRAWSWRRADTLALTFLLIIDIALALISII